MYRRHLKSWTKHIDFIIIDMICLQISFVVAYVFRYGLQNPWGRYPYTNMSILLMFIDVFVILFNDSMKNVLKRGYYKEFVQTVRHVLCVELFSILYLFSLQLGEEYSRLIFYMTGVFYVTFSYMVRLLWKKYLKGRMFTSGKRSLLIVTTYQLVDVVVCNIQNNNYDLFHIKGIAVINKDMNGQIIRGVPVVANSKTVFDYVCREWVDEVFLNLPKEDSFSSELIDKFTEMGVVVHIKLLEYIDFLGKKQFVERLGRYTVLTVSINTATAGQVILKRTMDIIGGLVGCLITGILYIILAPLIYRQSPGPIFFAQTRVGKNGKKFKIYKFRSMYVDAEQCKQQLAGENRISDGRMFKIDWDPRIIGSKKLADGTTTRGIGHFIREFSLDEFPQFFNVLKGDMSLVGTRPPTVDEWEKYAYYHRARLAIKPGLTGMWQVSGRSNITDFEDVVALDLKYIKEWSMGLDIKILLKTVYVVLRRDGAM